MGSKLGKRMFVVVMAALLGQSAGAQWPMFHYNRTHTGSCPHLGSMDPAIKWRSATIGDIEASPAIASNGMIYVGATDHSLYAIARNGVIRWKYQTANSITSSAAIGSDGTIYFGSMDGYVYALNPDGTLAWRYETGYWIRSSPTIGVDGTIYIGSADNYVYALNPNGSLRWSYPTGGWVESSPAIDSQGTIYVGSSDEYLYAIYPNGSLKWRYKTEGGVDSSPAIGSDGVIYFGSDDNSLYALNPNGSLRWRYATGGWIEASPAIGLNGVIYVGSNDGYLYAIRSDGSLAWRYLTGDAVESSPAIDCDGVIYVGSDDRYLYALNPDGSLNWRTELGYRVQSSPAVNAQGDIIIGSEDLYALGRKTKWTVMVYLTADNDLERSGLFDFLELAEIGSTEDVTVVVQFDRIAGYEAAYGDWSTCHRFVVTQGMTPTEANALPEWGDGMGGREVDMGDPQTLIDFTTWASDSYFADNYALILWNHGTGWTKRHGNLLSRGVCLDETSGSIMSVADGEWRYAMSEITAYLGARLELVGIDACLMQMLEVGYEIETAADFFVASEEQENVNGWSYDEILAELSVDPLMTAESLGRVIVDTAIDASGLLTESLVELTHLGTAVNALNTLSLRLLEAQQLGYWSEIAAVRAQVQRFDLPAHNYRYIDLIDLTDLLAGQSSLPQNVRLAAQTLSASLAQVVRYSRHAASSDYERANGIAIYYPENPMDYTSQYEGLLLARDTNWGRFLTFSPPRRVCPDLLLNDTELTAGDLLRLDLNILNYGPQQQVQLYVLMEIPLGSISLYYYYPTWTPELQYIARNLQRGQNTIENIMTLTWPQGAGSCNLLRFWSLFLNPVTGAVVGQHDSVDWRYY